MAISDERMAELEPWTIQVYQQLQAGFAIADIKAQFSRIENADPEEVAWVLSMGKQRYVGYYDLHKNSNRASAKWTIGVGIGLIILLFLVLQNFGWSTAGRQNGKIIVGILVGVGALGYGTWEWFSATPNGRRQDLDQL